MSFRSLKLSPLETLHLKRAGGKTWAAKVRRRLAGKSVGEALSTYHLRRGKLQKYTLRRLLQDFETRNGFVDPREPTSLQLDLYYVIFEWAEKTSCPAAKELFCSAVRYHHTPFLRDLYRGWGLEHCRLHNLAPPNFPGA